MKTKTKLVEAHPCNYAGLAAEIVKGNEPPPSEENTMPFNSRQT